MIIYFGRIGWGWKMYGIGYQTKWFFGLSLRHDGVEKINPKELVGRIKNGERYTVLERLGRGRK